MFNKEVVKAVGFDLDECLYPSHPEINNRIRNKLAEGLLLIKPDLTDLATARGFFESRYSELQSGRKVLLEAGYEIAEADRIADEAVSRADILDLLEPDPRLAKILDRMSQRYPLYLLTSSPRESALQKLERLTINPFIFNERFYGDMGLGPKQEGSPFRYITAELGIPAANHVYVGNSIKSDIAPAKKIGMQTILVWSQSPEADLSIPTIYDLEGIFCG